MEGNQRFLLKIFIFLVYMSTFNSIAQKILFCASCTSSNIAKFARKSRCICSPADAITPNYKVCNDIELFSEKKCKGNLGYCCLHKDINGTCPLCSTNSFTRNSDCECETLNLERNVMIKPITTEDDDEAYCCEDITIIPTT